MSKTNGATVTVSVDMLAALVEAAGWALPNGIKAHADLAARVETAFDDANEVLEALPE